MTTLPELSRRVSEAEGKSCAACRHISTEDAKGRQHCTWKMTEPAPSWLLASWRPSDRSAVKYPDENWSERILWIGADKYGHDCEAFLAIHERNKSDDKA